MHEYHYICVYVHVYLRVCIRVLAGWKETTKLAEQHKGVERYSQWIVICEVVVVLLHSQVFQFFTQHDLERLQKYSQQLADLSLITDLVPLLCSLYFARRLSPVQLSFLQEAALLGMGGQRRQRKG